MIITFFPMGSDFEKSVNHPRGPRWWLQIGPAATGFVARARDGATIEIADVADLMLECTGAR